MRGPLHRIYDIVFGKAFEVVMSIFLKINATPNQITVLRFLLLILPSMFLFSLNNYLGNIVALVLFHVFVFLDYVDGEIARIRKMATKIGEILDPIVDYSGHILIIIGIILGLLRSEGIFQIAGRVTKIPVELLFISGLLTIAGMLFTIIIVFKFKDSFDSLHSLRLRGKNESEYTSTKDWFSKNIIFPNNFPFAEIFKTGTILTICAFLNIMFIPLVVFSFTLNIRAVTMLYYWHAHTSHRIKVR